MGWTGEFLGLVNDPEYPPLRDVGALAHALESIRATGQKLVVLPDFDMDGITSGVLGYAGLTELGFNVELYVPDYNRGHDIAVDAIDELVARHPGVEAIITCDGGVNSHPGIQRGRDLGLTMLVTDHHLQLPTQPDGTAVSPAHVLVNPARLDETYPHPGICGAFVLYQSLMYYAAKYQPSKQSDISLLALFAGIGTVSDVMPLQYENRKVVRDSLSLAGMLRHYIASGDTVTEYDIDKSVLMMLLNARHAEGGHTDVFVRAFRGFAYTLQSWVEAGKLKGGTGIQADFYGFYLAPAFNALRRVGAPMEDAFNIFTRADPKEQFASAQAIIQWNEQRKEMTEFWMQDLLDRDQPLAPHVWLSAAPAGMLGLLASKLMQEHQVPLVVVHDQGDPSQPLGGSARSPMWFKVITTLTNDGYIAVGHEQACGVRADSLTQLAEIAQLLRDQTAAVKALIELETRTGEPMLDYDLALGITVDNHTPADGLGDNPDTLLDLARRIDALAPFGHQFPRPKIRFVVNLARCSMDVLGAEQTHLKIVLPSGLKLLWWNAAKYLPDLLDLAESAMPGHGIVEFDTDLSVNTFMGNSSPQATIERIIAPQLEE
jgi:single-stranded-DNA-specific exonuclease